MSTVRCKLRCGEAVHMISWRPGEPPRFHAHPHVWQETQALVALRSLGGEAVTPPCVAVASAIVRGTYQRVGATDTLFARPLLAALHGLHVGRAARAACSPPIPVRHRFHKVRKLAPCRLAGAAA